MKKDNRPRIGLPDHSDDMVPPPEVGSLTWKERIIHSVLLFLMGAYEKWTQCLNHSVLRLSYAA